MGYRLIIFDFDGTLADSAAWFAGALNGVARNTHTLNWPVSDDA